MWLDAWEADRQECERSRRTASHGMSLDQIEEHPKTKCTHGSAPLASWHTGPWTVLPVDVLGRPEDARLPFQWVTKALVSLQAKGSPAAFPAV